MKTVARTWDSLAERADAPAFATYGDNAVRTLFTRYGTSLSDTCIWWRRVFVPYIEGLLSAGIEAEGMKETLNPPIRLRGGPQVAADVLAPVRTARHREAELHALREWRATESRRSAHKVPPPPARPQGALPPPALVDLTPGSSRPSAAFRKLLGVTSRSFARRTANFLKGFAPPRTSSGRTHSEAGDPGFTTSNPSPEITNAWLYRQLERIYTRAAAADLDARCSPTPSVCAPTLFARRRPSSPSPRRGWPSSRGSRTAPRSSTSFSLAAYMKRAVGLQGGRKSRRPEARGQQAFCPPASRPYPSGSR
ncbi:MAG: hypothetical protein ACLUNV_09225 [Sutterella wadsworthensis]